jgi:hypothetical protein
MGRLREIFPLQAIEGFSIELLTIEPPLVPVYWWRVLSDFAAIVED